MRDEDNKPTKERDEDNKPTKERDEDFRPTKERDEDNKQTKERDEDNKRTKERDKDNKRAEERDEDLRPTAGHGFTWLRPTWGQTPLPDSEVLAQQKAITELAPSVIHLGTGRYLVHVQYTLRLWHQHNDRDGA